MMAEIAMLILVVVEKQVSDGRRLRISRHNAAVDRAAPRRDAPPRLAHRDRTR